MPQITSCPSDNLLTKYNTGHLSSKSHKSIQNHINECPECREKLLRFPTNYSKSRKTPVEGIIVDEPRKRNKQTKQNPKQKKPNNSRKPNVLGKLGHYQLLDTLGRGGMGTVFKAFDEVLQRIVAVKVMAAHLIDDPVSFKRFAREAVTAAATKSDFIVTVFGVEEAEGLPFLVMEYVEGVSLQDRLEVDGPLPIHDILQITSEIAQGLAAAHAKGVVHRDIKPANILLAEPGGRVKITDFGLAKALQDDSRLTQSGIVGGTPHFMAPEQAYDLPVDGRADLFSLGCVVYAMCTGQEPFQATSPMAVMRLVCEEEPKSIRIVNRKIPDWLEQFVAKMQSKNPDHRFQTALEVAGLAQSYLTQIQRSGPYANTPSTFPSIAKRPKPRSSKKKLWLVALLAIVLFFGTVFGLAYFLRNDPEDNKSETNGGKGNPMHKKFKHPPHFPPPKGFPPPIPEFGPEENGKHPPPFPGFRPKFKKNKDQI